MQTLKTFIAGVAVFISACAGHDQQQMAPIATNVVVPAPPPPPENPIDSATTAHQPAEYVVNFLKWYNKHEKRLADNHLVYNVTSEDPAKVYSVNFDATEDYLSTIRESGFVSREYVRYMRRYFKQCEEHFKKNPQSDGPPDGFDLDLVMWSQEYDDDLAHPDSATVMLQKIEGDKAHVRLGFTSGSNLDYRLSKSGSKWMLDKIGDWPED
jgi:hypothetical protein